MTGPAERTGLGAIEHIVVLMLENRAFDHLVGYLKADDARVAGLTGHEYNYVDPRAAPLVPVPVTRATGYTMPFDPGHEFPDVQMQLYGPRPGADPAPNPPASPAPMSGFAFSALAAAATAEDAAAAPRVMEGFQPDQVPVVAALAREFALCNYWFSSLPGPTWPNRFFVHAATSGGLTDSPDTGQILAGFSFAAGTIYGRLGDAGLDWRIYHDGLPQTAGIDALRLEYIDPFTKHFLGMDHFEADVASPTLPPYVFIEPNYDTGHNYVRGNSMHPLNDIRRGERLLKRVYEGLRASRHWESTLLVVTFDEHGGFYDHVPPPAATPTGDDERYAHPGRGFAFDALGVRVPAIAASAWTERGTVLGADPATRFDHTSVLATVEKRFGVKALTRRDAAAATLEGALNRATPRTDAPRELPDPVADSWLRRFVNLFRRAPAAAAPGAPLSENQQSLLGIALACDLQLSDKARHEAIRGRHAAIRRQRDAATYIREIEGRVRARRQAP